MDHRFFISEKAGRRQSKTCWLSDFSKRKPPARFQELPDTRQFVRDPESKIKGSTCSHTLIPIRSVFLLWFVAWNPLHFIKVTTLLLFLKSLGKNCLRFSIFWEISSSTFWYTWMNNIMDISHYQSSLYLNNLWKATCPLCKSPALTLPGDKIQISENRTQKGTPVSVFLNLLSNRN